VASQHQRLLTIDDDPTICRTVDLVAATAGFEARSTSDSAEFFRLVQEWQPTHLVLDLVMPGLDGLDVLYRLADMGTTAEVIVTSGQGIRVAEAAQRVAQELQLSTPGILPKPFTAQQLRHLLRLPQEEVPPANPPRPAAAATNFNHQEIAAAVERQEFVAHFQPKVDCRSGRVTGLEALARWQRPQADIVTPECFIAKAEESDLINALSYQVAEKALIWFGENYPNSDLELALNLSGRAIARPSLADALSELCQREGIATGRVVLEVTETYAMADPAAALSLLTRFRMRGFQLSIDDFGIGYSSLAQLARLPFSELKVDRFFVATARASSESRKIVAALVSLARNLGLRASAEGVEDDWTLDLLRDFGCHHAQGYHIARPMCPCETLTWLARSGAPPTRRLRRDPVAERTASDLRTPGVPASDR